MATRVSVALRDPLWRRSSWFQGSGAPVPRRSRRATHPVATVRRPIRGETDVRRKWGHQFRRAAAMTDYGSNATGTSETTDRRSGAEEDSPTNALRPTVSQIGGDRLANLRGQRQVTTLSALPPNAQLPCFPVDVIEFEKRRLTCAQAQASEQEQDGVIAAAQWSGAVDAVQQLPDLIRLDRSRDGRHRPMGHDWNRGAQIKLHLAAVTGKSEERAQALVRSFDRLGCKRRAWRSTNLTTSCAPSWDHTTGPVPKHSSRKPRTNET